MGSRRIEERNEKIIRGLMKLPPNRRCINCNILGPQYVCTNFWTFVCVTCSGIHREFTHRVKSVSMSKFTSQEVESLQAGGNQRAREYFLKHWDIQRKKLPDNSKPEKVREFIKSVYVDQKYTGTISSPDDDSRRASSYHSYSQSPPYDFQYEDRVYGKVTRKPGSERYLGKMNSFVSSPTRFSEDTFANESTTSRLSDFSVSSGGDLTRSPTSQDHRVSPPLANRQLPPVDLFTLPGAPASPFKTDSISNLPSTDVIRTQVGELSGWANFDSVQPPKPGDSLAISNSKPFQATEPAAGQHQQLLDNPPLDLFQSTKSFEDRHILPVNENELGLDNSHQPTEPRKEDDNRTKPVNDYAQQFTDLLDLKFFEPGHPTEPLKDNHFQPTNLLPLNGFGSVQTTEPVSETASNKTVSFSDLFSSGPAYATKFSGKSTNPFDDAFDSDITTHMMGYSGSLSESWFGSEVDVTHGATQMGNLSLGESVVSIGGNPFA